jgi:hypothetical protein
MAVGLPLKTTYANGDVYSASDVNDTNGTINITAAPYAAGKNKIINGDFRFNQRAFSSTTTSLAYGFDRFWLQRGAGGTVTYSAQTFTPGTAPVAGYEAINFARLVTVSQSATTDYAVLRQSIEDVRTFAGQTVTISAWIKAGTNGQLANFGIGQTFGGGGSGEVYTKGANLTLTTSWVRYSTTIAVPSIAGKTIGTNNSVQADIWTSAGSAISAYSSVGNQNATIDIWGLQVEAGQTATAFQTATGTIQGELAACQRYYWRNTPGTAYGGHSAIAITNSSTSINIVFNNPTSMRIAPTSIDFGNLAVFDTSVVTAISSLSIVSSQSSIGTTYVSAGGTGLGSLGRVQYVLNNNNTAGYFGASAEL